jgi:transcriptional regulator with XRE-family HTH domain
MIPIPERNRLILEMRKDGLTQLEVARRFKLSPSRIYLIEKQDAADRSLAGRRTRLREEIRNADDLERMWPVEDLVDAVGLIVVTKKRLMDHFVAAGKKEISLRELMDMCLDAPMEGLEFMMSPLLRISGVGKIGFWSVVNGLTSMDLGNRCNEEWQKRLVKVKQKHRVTGATPYSSGRE